MTIGNLIVRCAAAADAPSIAAIYDYHARHGTATFDMEGPGPDAWADKIRFILGRDWPFLVAECDDELVGYAYATQFRDRPAYAETCENSVYVSATRIGQGIGSRLLDNLKLAARSSGFTQMVAVVGGGEPASVALHARCGFVERGRMVAVGRKFGRLLDTVYMQAELLA